MNKIDRSDNSKEIQRVIIEYKDRSEKVLLGITVHNEYETIDEREKHLIDSNRMYLDEISS